MRHAPEAMGLRLLAKDSKVAVTRLLVRDVNERLGCWKFGPGRLSSKLNWHWPFRMTGCALVLVDQPSRPFDHFNAATVAV